MPLRVFITVAEASADQHAANLVRSLKQLRSDIEFEGLGGPRMREAGVMLHRETTQRAAMGWRAALRAREVSHWLRLAHDRYAQSRFDLQICCDSWSMNWHFARLAKEHNTPVLYYIAPQTWASREGRVKRLRRYVDRLACILPFEENYFRQHGVNATYVGHPLFDELQHRPASESRSFGDSPVIGLLPGSRVSIARANFPHQLDVARRITNVFPRATFLVPTTDVTHGAVSRMLSPGLRVLVQRDAFDAFVPRCDFVVTVSGTAALHVAAHGVPMIVVYRGNPVLWHAVGRWVVKTRTYSLVNILSDEKEHIVPEFIPWYGSNAPVADAVIDFLRDPEKLARQRRDLAAVIAKIGKAGASDNTAKLALTLVRS